MIKKEFHVLAFFAGVAFGWFIVQPSIILAFSLILK